MQFVAGPCVLSDEDVDSWGGLGRGGEKIQTKLIYIVFNPAHVRGEGWMRWMSTPWADGQSTDNGKDKPTSRCETIHLM